MANNVEVAWFLHPTFRNNHATFADELAPAPVGMVLAPQSPPSLFATHSPDFWTMNDDNNDAMLDCDMLDCDPADAGTNFDEGDCPSFVQNPQVWAWASMTPRERQAQRELARVTMRWDREDSKLEEPVERQAGVLASLDRLKSTMSQDAWDHHMTQVVAWVGENHNQDLSDMVDALRERHANRAGDFTSEAAWETALSRREERLWLAIAAQAGNTWDEGEDAQGEVRAMLADSDD